MTVLIESDNECGASGGLTFAPGVPVEVHDHELARQLLAIPGFHEVIPDGETAPVLDPAARTAVTEPAPEPDEPTKASADTKAADTKTPAKSSAKSSKSAVTES